MQGHLACIVELGIRLELELVLGSRLGSGCVSKVSGLPVGLRLGLGFALGSG